MNTFEIIIQVLILCFLFYLTFFKSYFKEKGKNVATKEDIGEITGIIEKIKANFTNETEGIKHELQFINQKRMTLLSEERNAILNYYDSFYNYYCQLMTITLSNIDTEGDDDLFKVVALMDKLRLEYNLASGRRQLYFSNKAIINADCNLAKKSLELEKLITLTILDLKKLIHLRKLVDVGPILAEKLSNVGIAIKKETDKINEFYLERSKISEELYSIILIVRGILVGRLEEILK